LTRITVTELEGCDPRPRAPGRGRRPGASGEFLTLINLEAFTSSLIPSLSTATPCQSRPGGAVTRARGRDGFGRRGPSQASARLAVRPGTPNALYQYSSHGRCQTIGCGRRAPGTVAAGKVTVSTQLKTLATAPPPPSPRPGVTVSLTRSIRNLHDSGVPPWPQWNRRLATRTGPRLSRVRVRRGQMSGRRARTSSPDAWAASRTDSDESSPLDVTRYSSSSRAPCRRPGRAGPGRPGPYRCPRLESVTRAGGEPEKRSRRDNTSRGLGRTSESLGRTAGGGGGREGGRFYI
jgi:hypothetical protein